MLISYRYVNVRLRGVFSLIYFMTSITGRKRTDTLGDVSGAVKRFSQLSDL